MMATRPDIVEEIKDGVLYFIADGDYIRCVSCRQPKGYNPESRRCNHKCSKVHTGQRAGAMTRGENQSQLYRRKSYHARLADGFNAGKAGE